MGIAPLVDSNMFIRDWFMVATSLLESKQLELLLVLGIITIAGKQWIW